ncbi:MAG: transcription termination/antitermination factor NusG [Planctomycetota bacterium]|nr:MAG: transcription termination/antitermination factor NusG [Planctomycetota bacterium]
MNLGDQDNNQELSPDQATEAENQVIGSAAESSEAAVSEPTPAEPTDSKSTQPSAISDTGAKLEPTREGMKWYVLRVASNKEEQVRDALERKVRIELLVERIGRVLVPTLKEKRMKSGQVRVIEKKLYPGYVFVEMATDPDGSIPENIWFMVKETMGVGDFIGSGGKPTSMKDHDVEMMLLAAAKPEEEATLHGMEFSKGDRVKIKEGSFENYEGNVDSIDEAKGIVTVLLTIFGRATPVDVEYWQLEKL